jgi:4-hydroxybenzoate polyprenyltransferase
VSHPLGRLALLHPFPSALNAGVVAVIATVAGAAPATAITAALAMLGFQVSIGALNDLVDAPADAIAQPWKPIASGQVGRRAAYVVVATGVLSGATLSLLLSPLLLAIGLAGYGWGVAYDLWLKGRGLGWVAFSAAFPLLLLYAWTAGGGGLPPGWQALLPLAAIAGPTLHLANALVDLDADARSGHRSVAVRLGRRRAVQVLVVATVAVQALAWVVILGIASGPGPLAIGLVSSIAAACGLVATAHPSGRGAAWGWSLQAIAVALLAVAWVLAVA